MDAQASLTSGHYEQAFDQAIAIDETEALLVAAEALNTKILLGQSDDEKADAQRAMAIGQSILTKNPDHNEAKLLYAISYGFYGRGMSPLSAWRKKMPQKIRATIETAVAANAEDPNSFALYGGWHMAVAAKAGTKRAKKMFGATAQEGIVYFEQALSGAPDNIMINGNYIMMLYASDPEQHGKKVEKLLAHMRTLEPQNAAERQVQFVAKSLGENIDEPKKAKKIAKKFLGW